MDAIIDKNFNLPPLLGSARSTHWQMALVAHQRSQQSLVLLQEAVNHLEEKARKKILFTEAEKTFLKALLESPWWGGKNNGFNQSKLFLNPDAGIAEEKRTISEDPSVRNIEDLVQLHLGKLVHHYVNGGGQVYALELSVYRNSLIVRDTLFALKNYIRELFAFNKPATFVATDDLSFLKSAHAEKIEKRRLHSNAMGFIFVDGTLLLEQKDTRLRNLANRFKITAMTHQRGPLLVTRWRIEGCYRFAPFGAHHEVLELPLEEGMGLKISSGLCNYMLGMGVACPFDYFADWSEQY